MRYCLNKKLIATSLCAVFLLSCVSLAGVGAAAELKVYDFQDSTNNIAYWGNNNTRPLPALVGSNEIIFDAGQYGKIAHLDNSDCETSDGLTDYSDYHRFAFRIFEPVSNILSIYVKHVGYGNYYWDVTQNPGLTLYIWNNSISQWSYLDDHNNGTANAITDYTITSNIGWYINGSGYVNLLAQAKENTGSCPFLYTFNGEKYVFVTDMFNRGMLSLSVRSMQPEDFAKIEEDQLPQTDGLYKLQITQEYDEISYLDKVTLITVDHPSNVDVFPSLLKELGKIYTVSKDLATPISASDANGNDVLKQISARDGQFTIAEQYELNYLDLNLGNLSGANNIKLVLTAYTNWDNSEVLTSNATNRHGGFVQVKDSGGNWVTVYSKELTTPSALPRTYVLNMTGKFITEDYSVRIAYYPDVRFDYIGIDTSPEAAVTVNSLAPNYADLHFRGYSVMSGSPSIPNYYDSGPSPIEGYSYPSGNFTRFGDVLPLIMNRDDEFVIMHHGDEISASFAYIPPEEGLERDFLLYSWGYYKGSPYPTGDSVDPLPFYGMSTYPYNSTESYPSDPEHLAYLQMYNTRSYSGSSPEPPEHATIYTDYVMVQLTISPAVGGFIMPENLLQILAPFILAAVAVAIVSVVAIKRMWPYPKH
jgi:hypothetical protein